MGAIDTHHFEHLYRAHADPWHVASAWYERRKRELLLATLGRENYLHAFEPGCGNGEMTRRLAARCTRLCAVDVASAAIGRCRARLAADGIRHVDVMALDLPWEWPPIPPGGFDLIVVSEVAYYLDDAALTQFLHAVDASLASGGELIACHWRPDFNDRVQSTDVVHDTMAALPGLAAQAQHREDAFRLDLWRRQS
ncbi:class I SAM-dependent DNA methyltransferase [Achromobacter sp. NPDC008082]|uniref:class I SAM-dependent DNA methyltransferase n=1 Tax=Achromobacter sp. NPDC008082 TaxID=3363888 RepID=UPI0036EF785E